MFLSLNDLSDDELAKKLNDLYGKLKHLEQFGGHNSIMHQQCRTWIQQIVMEMQERQIEDEESGTVAYIGEESEEVEEFNKEKEEKDGKTQR